MSVPYETPGDALREAYRRITRQIERAGDHDTADPFTTGLRIAREEVQAVLVDVIDNPPEPVATLPLLDNLCPSCGLTLQPEDYEEGRHPECAEERDYDIQQAERNVQ